MKYFLSAVGFSLLGSMALYGNLVVPAGTGTWNTAVTADSNNADAFWDNQSLDNGPCNVGYWLQSANWAANPAPQCDSEVFSGTGGPGAPLNFLSGATANTPVGWEMQASGPNTMTLRLTVSAWSGNSIFGYYTYNGSNRVLGPQLFAGTGELGVTKDITVIKDQMFGFYICPNGNCANIMYSGDTYGSVADTKAGKFALFSEVPAAPTSSVSEYWVGVEDQAGTIEREVWGDYNDILIKATAVPEPGFISVLGLGLAGLAVQAYRRKKQAV